MHWPARFMFVFCAALAFTACGHMPTVTTTDTLSTGTVGVVDFQDCHVADRRDCPDSGATAARIFREEFAAAGFGVVPIARQVSANEVLDDDDAMADAEAAGCQYVLVGEVTDYRSVAAMTLRLDSAGVSVRLLDVSDGSIIARFAHEDETGSNFASPDDVIERIARHFVGAL